MQKVELRKVKVYAKLNLTADDWQLYGIPGRTRAAQGLNREISRKLSKGEIDGLYSVLSKYSKWGAADSEGVSILAQVLQRCGLNDETFI